MHIGQKIGAMFKRGTQHEELHVDAHAAGFDNAHAMPVMQTSYV